MASCGFLLLMGLVASAGLIWDAGAQGITFQKANLTLFPRPGAMSSSSMSPTMPLRRNWACAIDTTSVRRRAC